MVKFRELKFVPFKNIQDLKIGDLIRHVNGTESLVITGTYGDYAIGTRTMHISNPNKWQKVEK